MNFSSLCLFLLAMFATRLGYSQNGVIISENQNDEVALSAILELKSTNKGFLVPRMTQTQKEAIPSPANGLLVFQTDNTTGFYVYNNGWEMLGGEGGNLTEIDPKVGTQKATYIPRYNGDVLEDGPLYSFENTSGSVVYFENLLTGQPNILMGTATYGGGYLINWGVNGFFNSTIGGLSEEFPNNGSISLHDEENNVKLRTSVGSNDAGLIELNGANGNVNINLSSNETDPNLGNIAIFGDNEITKVNLGARKDDNGTYGFSELLGPNGNILHEQTSFIDGGEYNINDFEGNNLIKMWGLNGGGAFFVNGVDKKNRITLSALGSYGRINLYGNDGDKNVELYTSGNTGYIYADEISAVSKNFRVPHPTNPNKEIWYTSMEGPEAAMYVRGTIQLTNGEAQITLPEHFTALAVQEGLTIQVTPWSAASKGLAVTERNTSSFTIKELANGMGNYKVDWEVKAIRKGFEDYKVVRDKRQ